VGDREGKRLFLGGDGMLKTCPGCERELETEGGKAGHFYRQSRAKDGWDTYCKDCRSLWRSERRGRYPVKLLQLKGPTLSPSQRKEAELLEGLHCRVFVSNGRQVMRFGQAWRGYTPLEEWLEKFEGRYETLVVG
jgi:hypothetical protein